MNFSYCLFFLVAVLFVSGDALMDPCGYQREKCMAASEVNQNDLLAAEKNLTAISVNIAASATISTSLITSLSASININVLNYIGLFGKEMGIIRIDGRVDVALKVEIFRNVCPKSISSIIFACCEAKVYGGKAPPKDQVAAYYGMYTTCIMSMMPTPIWDIMGVFKAPVFIPKGCSQNCGLISL